MKDLGDGIWVTERALSTLPSVDTVIFDVDGVLIDVSKSFRQVISRTTQYYMTQVVGRPDDELYLRPEETEHFKRAGGFNSDWALTHAALLLALAKGRDGQSAAEVRAAAPGVEDYMAATAKKGGGMENAKAALRETLGPEAVTRAEALLDEPKVERIFAEFYAGRSHCLRVYGFEPEIVDQECGELTRETVIIDPAALVPRFQYGVVTGRLRGELDVAMEMTALEKLIHPTATMTADDGMHKPDPNGLIALAERMRPAGAIFVGDTLDDMRTVLNYRKAQAGPPFLAAQVLTGPAGEKNRRFFADAGADIIAPDVNSLLRWLGASAQ